MPLTRGRDQKDVVCMSIRVQVQSTPVLLLGCDESGAEAGRVKSSYHVMERSETTGTAVCAIGLTANNDHKQRIQERHLGFIASRS